MGVMSLGFNRKVIRILFKENLIEKEKFELNGTEGRFR